jgi:hypothetical protein
MLIAGIVTTCSIRQSANEGDLICIDVSKKYPQKEISLTDIADVTYVHLCSDNSDFLYDGRSRILDITANTIVVANYRDCVSILFFSKDGTPKSRFNRCGQGPEEILSIRYVIYDEAADDVFVTEFWKHNIVHVYSSAGEYKRRIIVSAVPEKNPMGGLGPDIVSFDDRSLFLFDRSKRTRREWTKSPDDWFSPYYRICKIDGTVLDFFELPLPRVPVGLLQIGGLYEGKAHLGHSHNLIKCVEGVRLSNPENDTIFLYKHDGTLVPVMYQTPSVSSLNPMVYLNNYVENKNYQLIEVVTVRKVEENATERGFINGGPYNYPRGFLVRDKKTGEIVRPKFVLPDYMGKELTYFSNSRGFTENWMGGFLSSQLCLIELKQAYRENKLSGKLKDLVATLDEEKDNDVFMILNFTQY